MEWHRGELFARVGFIVTNLTRPAKRMVWFYNQRGPEQWIKEGKNAVKWTRLSCHDFADNQVRLHLFVLAYNLGNFLRQAALPPGGASLDLDGVAGEAHQDWGERWCALPRRSFSRWRGWRFRASCSRRFWKGRMQPRRDAIEGMLHTTKRRAGQVF